MKILVLITFSALFSPLWIFGQENKGLITIASSYLVKETTDSFIEVANSKGLTIFARIDHAANAARIYTSSYRTCNFWKPHGW